MKAIFAGLLLLVATPAFAQSPQMFPNGAAVSTSSPALSSNAFSYGGGALSSNYMSGATFNGNYVSVFGIMQVNVPPAGPGNFTGGWFYGFCNATQGGVAGAERGACTGTNPQVRVTPSGKYYNDVQGEEIDVEADLGSNPRAKVGLDVTTIGTDAVQGSVFDSAVVVSAVPGSPGWHQGINFSNYNNNWPFDAGATIIGAGIGPQQPAGPYAIGIPAVGTVTFGLDWSGVNFAAGGAPVVMPLITPPSSSSLCKMGSIEWDPFAVYICVQTNHWRRAQIFDF